ncbi:DUF2306 domain-containing protein [Streptomyces sp. NPDC047981]|uniref:DUF2306 domain-containing protein n=1 Tax=Streptomyces sp. NPDC047981 TaxID=3154610 RepID=UPI00341F6EB5
MDVRWGRVAAVAVTVSCVAYAPVAMTQLWPYASPGAPAFGEWIMGRMVSPEYVAEVVRDRIGPYGRSLLPLIVHSVLGGLLMLLGPLQYLSAVRRRRRLHQVAGTVFALTVYASMAGAALYLARTAPEDAFSGAAFWVVLATILVGTVGSVTLGVLAALGRFPDLHQRWMLLCYGYLMTAPLLRLEWGGLPWLFPGLSMAEINRIAVMHLGSVVVFGALLASRGLDRRTQVPGVSGTWCPTPVLVAAHVAGAAGMAWLAVALLDGPGAEGPRLLLGYLVPYAATYAVMAVAHVRAGRRGDGWAREEWRLHLAALCLAPVFSAGAALALERLVRLDPWTSLVAGAAIGCGVMAYAATAVVSLRVMHGREVLARGERMRAKADADAETGAGAGAGAESESGAEAARA